MAEPNGADSRPPSAQPVLEPARAKAESRTANFMRSALAILGETGRTDFTVLEVVERSKTSLRAFYHDFATKDELLLALIDQIMSESAVRWRAETAGMTSTTALRVLIDRVAAATVSSTQDSINRALTSYNGHLVETRPLDFARILRPLHELIRDIIRRGIDEGSFRSDVDVDSAATILMQTMLNAMRLRALGAELSGQPVDSARIYDFAVRGLSGRD
jgi:AcrR family transcriptional regulator